MNPGEFADHQAQSLAGAGVLAHDGALDRIKKRGEMLGTNEQGTYPGMDNYQTSS